MMPEEDKTTQEVVQEEQKIEETVNSGWDKERQKIDQLTKNVTKLANDKSEVASQIAAMTERSQAMLDKVAGLEQQLSSVQTEQTKESDNLDPDMYDEKLIKTITALKSEISNTQEQLKSSSVQVKTLLEAKDKYEANQLAEENKQRKTAVKEEILSKLDGKYGSKYRNEALRLAQQSVDDSGNPPEDRLGVYLLLEQQYISLAGKAPGERMTSVPVDTGEGGKIFNEGEIKEGSRKEVLNEIMSKFKGKSFTMPKI